MRYWQREHTFNHSWETVVQAAIRKYPNPVNPSVVSQDVVSREVTPSGVLHSHRLFGTVFFDTMKQLSSLLGVNPAGVMYASEHTTIDPQAKRYELRSRNLTYTSFGTMEETLEYLPHPSDPEKRTVLKQSVRIRCPYMGPVIESRLLENVYKQNAHKGVDAIEWVIANCDLPALPQPPPPPPQTPPPSPPPLQRRHRLSSYPSTSSWSWSSSSSSSSTSDFSRLCQAVEAGVHQVSAEVKHLTRAIADEYFLIM